MTLLETKDLKKYYPKRKSLRQYLSFRVEEYNRAVDGVTVSLDKGKVLVLAGRSGSGKTTVARLIMRAEEPTEGTILFEGQDITHWTGSRLKEFRRSVQMVFQDPYSSLDPRIRILDSVMEPLTVHERTLSKSQMNEKARGALMEVGLTSEEIATALPHSLSGGQRQRVALARALVLRPSLIVADEPVSMLDVSIKGEILRLMQTLKEKFNISYIYITHDLSTARYIGDHLAIMKDGKIIEVGEIDRVLSDPFHPYTKSLIEAVPQIPDCWE